MITLYLEAANLGELRAKMYAILGDALGGNYATQAGPQDLPTRHYTSPPPASYNEQPGEYAGAATQAPPARDPVPEASDKPRRKHRATRPPVATPDVVQDPVEDTGLGGYDEMEVVYVPPEEALQGLTVASTPLTDSLTNEKVKAEVIGRLADLFTAGKVKVLRGLLDQYGDGAKSFPEIDAAKFPEIREALDRGIAA